MENIAKRLSEIEMTARSILESAEQSKHGQEYEMQKERDQFDAQLERSTKERIEEIRGKLLANKDELIEEQKQQNNKAIATLQNDFQEHHTEYAAEILAKITEV